MNDQKSVLSQGIEALGLQLSVEQQLKLLDYLELLQKWNRAYNLTAIRDPQQMVALQLLDSFAALPYIGEGNLLDVGSGGGLPGIPIAVANPDQQVTLLDSNSKKTRFLNQARMELKLENLSVVHSRLEAWQPAKLPQIVISRAFTDLPQMLKWVGHLMTPASTLLAMKGRLPMAELDTVAETGLIIETIPLQIPGIDGERHLVRITGFST